MSKEDYQEAINNSPFFDIDKNTNEELWNIQNRKLKATIAEYYQTYVMGKDGFNKFGMALALAMNDTLKSYKKDKGVFLHYLNVAFKKKKLAEIGDAKCDEVRKGLSIGKTNQKIVKKFFGYVKRKNLNENDVRVREKLAKLCGVTLSELDEVLKLNNSAVAIYDHAKNDKNEEMSIFDTMSDCVDVTQEIESPQGVVSIYEKIDVVFESLQQRSKPIVSALFTRQLLESGNIANAEDLANYQFCDMEMLSQYIKTGTVPLQQDICENLGISTASGSRTLKTFKERCGEAVTQG